MMTDFLLLYEGRFREIESICLLSEELKTRGYSVLIKNIYDPVKYFIRPNVVVVPHLYNEQQLMSFCNNKWRKNTKIISLQWEQILTKDESINDIHNPQGQAVYAHHIAWGDNQVRRYKLGGIKNDHIWKTGSISMDLLSSEFDDYFLNREQVAKSCNLDIKKEWVVFISSLSYANITEETKKKWELMNPDTREFADISQKTFDTIVKWLKKAAHNNPNMIFIYRRHPAELGNTLLEKEFSTIPNLKLIEAFSMRQWVKVADRFYNWYSTSMADVYFAGRKDILLRPVDIPERFDIDVFDGAERITTYERFEESLNEAQPLKKNASIVAYYGDGEGRMAYQKIANLCEMLLNDQIKGFDFDFGPTTWLNLYGTGGVLNIVKSWAYYILFKICNCYRISKLPIIKNKQHEVDLWKKDIYGIQDDIKMYSERLRPFVKKNYSNGKK